MRPSWTISTAPRRMTRTYSTGSAPSEKIVAPAAYDSSSASAATRSTVASSSASNGVWPRRKRVISCSAAGAVLKAACRPRSWRHLAHRGLAEVRHLGRVLTQHLDRLAVVDGEVVDRPEDHDDADEQNRDVLPIPVSVGSRAGGQRVVDLFARPSDVDGHK